MARYTLYIPGMPPRRDLTWTRATREAQGIEGASIIDQETPERAEMKRLNEAFNGMANRLRFQIKFYFNNPPMCRLFAEKLVKLGLEVLPTLRRLEKEAGSDERRATLRSLIVRAEAWKPWAERKLAKAEIATQANL